jgi:hypothetical protein
MDRRYNTARVTPEVRGGVAVSTVKGLVTPCILHGMLLDASEWVAAQRATAHVIDIRAATMGVSMELLERTKLDVLRENLSIEAPTAWIVKVRDIDIFTSFADQMGRHGLCRAAFLGRRPAQEWCLKQARLHQASWSLSRPHLGSLPGHVHTGDAAARQSAQAHRSVRRTTEPSRAPESSTGGR